MKRVGLIGLGAIGSAIVQAWPEQLAGRVELTKVLVRSSQLEDAGRQVGNSSLVTDDIKQFLLRGPQIVVEAAGQGAVVQYGEAILAQGCEFHILSVGALACDELRERLIRTAAANGGRIVLPTGALAGFDGLLSLRAAGLTSVKYICSKPVNAWRETPAENVVQLEALREPRIIFTGTAREASSVFPRNANLAAAVALAGLGFDETTVELIADPTTSENSARIEACSASERLDVSLCSAGFSRNPKSSQITAMSAVAALRAGTENIEFA